MKLIALTGGIACGKSTVASEISKHPNVVIIDSDQIARSVWDPDTVPYQQLKHFFETDPHYSMYHDEMFPPCSVPSADESSTGEHNNPIVSSTETSTTVDDNGDNGDNDDNGNGDKDGNVIVEPPQSTTLTQSNELPAVVNRTLLGRLTFEHSDLRRVINSYSHRWIFRRIVNEIWNEWGTSHRGDGKVVVLDMPLFFETKVFAQVVSKVIVVTTPDRETQKQFLMRRNPHLSEEEANQRIDSQMPNHVKEQKADFVIRNSSDLDHLKLVANDTFLECVNAASEFGWGAAASLSAFYAYSHITSWW